MKEIDGKYYLLEETDLKGGYKAVVSLGNGNKSRVELFDGFRHTLFAQVENQLTWMVAHPRKPPLVKDGKMYVPEMWDIAGTSDYANKATWVEILERDFSQQRTMVHIKKVRFGHLGLVGECCVRMDPENHRFVGFDEEKTDAGNVIQYKLRESDKSNWLVSKAVQQDITWDG